MLFRSLLQCRDTYDREACNDNSDQERYRNDSLNVGAKLDLTLIHLVQLLRVGSFRQAADLFGNLEYGFPAWPLPLAKKVYGAGGSPCRRPVKNGPYCIEVSLQFFFQFRNRYPAFTERLLFECRDLLLDLAPPLLEAAG